MAEQYLAQTQQQKLQQVLAPQLRQSLECLQLPMLELSTIIQQEIEQNPTLEVVSPENTQLEIEPGSQGGEDDSKILEFKEQYEALAKLDEEWKEYFSQIQTRMSYTTDDEEKRQFFLDSLTEKESLQEHLLNQLYLSGLDEKDRQIGELIIGSINDDGYLSITLEELRDTTGVGLATLENLLKIIQEFNPVGVGARDLKECLLIQLARLGVDDPLTVTMIEQHLKALGAKKFDDIARNLGITVSKVQELGRFIGTLEPRPGRMFSSDTPNYIHPEVTIQKVSNKYIVLMNNDNIPHLHISKHYKRMLEDPTTPDETRSYIREKIQSGAFLIKSIHQRQQTIQDITENILAVQQEFMDHGVSHLRPLTMLDIAKKLGIHETTVSRAIANKYIQTPQGAYEMKYFFTPGYKKTDGSVVSNKTIKDLIKQYIDEEDPGKPLSDQVIANRLKDEGYKVARRTVTKYREALKILPSHLRK